MRPYLMSEDESPSQQYRGFGGAMIPRRGYVVGNGGQGRTAAVRAMAEDEFNAQRGLEDYRGLLPEEVITGAKLNNQGAWLNARLTAGSSQNFNGYYRPGQDTQIKPFILQGGTLAAPEEEAEPSFRPGLTGGVNRTPMHRPYNGGDFSTQRSGPVGPHYQQDAQGAVARHAPQQVSRQMGAPRIFGQRLHSDWQEDTIGDDAFAPALPQRLPADPMAGGDSISIPRNQMAARSMGYSTKMPNGMVRINGDGRMVDPQTGQTVFNPNKLGPGGKYKAAPRNSFGGRI